MAEQNGEMSFLEHIEVLRWHLVRSVVVILVLAVAAFIYSDFVFDTVIFGPKKPDFYTYVRLCELSAWLSQVFPALVQADTLCIGRAFPPLQNISMSGQFTTHMMISLIAGIIISFPFIMWEIWRFIKPALQEKERRYATGLVFITSLLFGMGVLFGYYLIAPLSINFLLTYEVSKEIANLPTLDTYISTLTTIVLASGITFELPVAAYFLARLGILSAGFMRTYRKHAIVIALIVAAIITPPDVFSQLLVTGPLLLLYEISIFIVARVEKHTA